MDKDVERALLKVGLLSTLQVLDWGLTFWVQRWDRRSLTKARRSRTWNTASWGSALYGFSHWSMIGWLWVTRQDWASWRRRGLHAAIGRSAWLLVEGLLASVAVALLIGAIGEEMVAAFGVSLDAFGG